MNTARIFFLVVVLGLPIGSSSAATVWTEDSAVRHALAENPEIVAARHVIAEAEARAGTRGRLANPEFEAEFAGGQNSEGRIEAGIMQRFPLTARLRLEQKLSAIAIERARLEVRERERQLALETRLTFFETLTAHEAVLVARRQADLAKAFGDQLEKNVSEGITSGLDAGEAALETAVRAGAVEERVAGYNEAIARLNGLLGLPAGSPGTVTGRLTLPSNVPSARPPGARPDLVLAGMAVEAGALEVSLARAARWEDVGVGIFVEGERFRDEPEGIEPEALLGVRLSVPLPIWQNGSARVRESQAAEERERKQLKALQLSVQNAVASAHRTMVSRHRIAELASGRVLENARRQVADVEGAYQRGEVDTQAVFRARARFVEIEFEALEARKNFFLSRAEWLAAIGDFSSQP